MPTYTLSGVEVDFPYEAYSCQLDYMTKVIQALQQGQHALLESPTGTGKTLCLLCATLAWRQSLAAAAAGRAEQVQQEPHTSTLVQGLREAWAEHRASKMAEGGPASGLPQIVYSSRTHSQLQQVMRELKACSYKPRSATVASRQHGCLHPVVSTMAAGANQACRALVSKRACKWYNGVERFVRANPDANAEVLDIEDLGRIGEARTACPYYLARELAATADIVFMPYNYLLDAKTRGGLGIAWKDAVLIFDEAHNVEQVCSDSMSFDLPASALAAAIEELGTAAEVAANKGDAPVNVFNELGGQDRNVSLASVAADLQRGRAVLCRLEQEIAALNPHPENGLTRPGAFLFELLGRCGITGASWRVLHGCLDTAMEVLTDEAVEAGRRTGSRSNTYALHQVGEALRLAFVGTAALEPEAAAAAPPPPATGGQWPPPRPALLQLAAQELPKSHAAYRVHVHLQKNKNGRLTPTLSYWCFSPGLSMQQITDMQVRSILLTSGTLSPLDSFAHELALPFPVRLENPHVIAREQVWVGVVPSGPGGHALNSSYQNRDNAAYKSDLGTTLVNLCRIVPDGLLVFFPSYALLQNCMASWKQPPTMGGPSIWERIARSKQPVVEPRESAAFNAAAEDFRAKLANPAYNGAVFFAVTRGKASEGLDFSDSAGRAVVLTGIPYAMKTDPKVRLKQQTLDEARAAPRKRPAGGGGSGGAAAGLSGDQWYSQNALRAVNQAVGRVIRHRRDYGAIILCDERFRAPNVQRQLSCWLRGLVTVHASYGAANASLVQFFKAQGAAARAGLVDGGGQTSMPGSARPGPFAAAAAAPGARDGAAAPPLAGSGGGRSLLQQVPAAIDAVGMTELFAPVAAAAAADARTAQQVQQQQAQQAQQQPARDGRQGARDAGGASRLMAVIGGGGSSGGGGDAVPPPRQLSGPTAAAAAAAHSLLGELGAAGPQQPQQAAAAATASSKLFEPRPWERAALAAAARPCPPRPQPLAAAGGGPTSNIVGPAHLVARHAERQRARSASVEPEQRAAAAAAGDEGAPGRQQGPQPRGEPAEQQQQQQPQQGGEQGGQPLKGGPAGEEAGAGAKAGKAEQRQEAVASFLHQLKASLPKEDFDRVRGALRGYSRAKDVAALLAAALPLLVPHTTLLEAFLRFLPKAARPAAAAQVEKLREAGAARAPAAASAAAAVAAATATPRGQQAPPGLAGMAASHPQQRQQQQQQQRLATPWTGHSVVGQAAGQGIPPRRQPLVQQQAQRLPPPQPPLQQQQAGQLRGGQPQRKLQQLVSGGRPGELHGHPRAAAPTRPGAAAALQSHQLQRGGMHPPPAAMPPRGMQAALQSAAAQRAAGQATAGQGPRPVAAFGGSGSSAAGRPGGLPARGPACPVCHKKPMDAPHEAACGHTACYACWLKALAQFKCPVCGRGVRKTQLTKKFFA